IDKTVGPNRTAATLGFTGFDADPTVTTVAFVDGLPEITGGTTDTPPAPGIWQQTVEAEKDVFNVTHDGRTASIAIGGIKGGIGGVSNAIEIKDWQDATVAKVNADLKTAGILGVEATFGNDGKMSI